MTHDYWFSYTITGSGRVLATADTGMKLKLPMSIDDMSAVKVALARTAGFDPSAVAVTITNIYAFPVES